MKKKKVTVQDVLDILASQSAKQEILTQQISDFAKQMAESKAKFEETLEKICKKFEAELKKNKVEFEMSESSADFETDLLKSNTELDKRFNYLTSPYEDFVEEMIRPNIIPMFQAKGINVETLLRSVVGKKDGNDYYEIDWLLIDTNIAIVAEIETKFTRDDVDEHLERLARICEIPPKHIHLNGMSILGAAAAITFEDGVDQYALKKGLYVLKQTGNIVSIINEESFKPKEWKTNY